ncbi:MAG: permease prefix domain 1-containing protein [Candidatus Helarchaeota archaeon]|nr:permease prefix domain 1-containing protein [Candidatus Helarchaeota archaeon]
MSDDQYGRKVIKDFLSEIELKLPAWLKADPEEVQKVLKELEEHIEDKIEALEQTGKSRTEAVHTAISEMGSPAQIAREYKRRGTPKFYITEELFSEYINVLKIMGFIVLAIAAISATVNVIINLVTATGDWWAPILSGLQGGIVWGVIAAGIITIVFVWLSYEGFLPQDFRKILNKKKVGKSQAQIQVVPPKTTIGSLESVKKSTYPKGVEKRSDLIAGGVFGIIFAVFAISQPFETLNELINPLFLQLLLFIGIFWLVDAIFELIHSGFVSWSFTGNRVLYPIRALISLASLVVLAQFLIHPEIFPIFWWPESGFTVLSIAPEFYWIYYLVLSLVILGTVIGALHKIYRAATLKIEDFLEA